MDPVRAELEDARQRLAAAFDEVNQQLQELSSWVDELTVEDPDEGREEFAAFARSDEAPEELRRLQEQIDRGELSWYRVLTDEGGDAVDPRAAALISQRLADLAALGEAVRSGASPEEAVAQVERDRADKDNGERTR